MKNFFLSLALCFTSASALLTSCADTPNTISAEEEKTTFQLPGNHPKLLINGTNLTLINQINGYTFSVQQNPARVEVKNGTTLMATFTDKCYTVSMLGPNRTLSETNSSTGTTNLSSYSVSHNVWVRRLTAPFNLTSYQANTTASIETLRQWIYDATLANNAGAKDILAIALDYIENAPSATGTFNNQTVQIAGDANYGPLKADGTREEGSDYNDYMQVTVSYSTPWAITDAPEANQSTSLDCSGFMRMVWGARSSSSQYLTEGRLPLTTEKDTATWDVSNTTLPRRSYQIWANSPGIVVIPKSQNSVQGDVAKLNIGDIVFFDADTTGNEAGKFDHVGMYIGKWQKPGTQNIYYRFISSRKSVNGPTFGDYKGASLLNYSNNSLYTTSFKGAKRF